MSDRRITILSAKRLGFQALGEAVRLAPGDVLIEECYGERFIGSAARDRTITVNGTPGNALGCYLDGADIIVNGNVQDAVGDTMNDGRIIVTGHAGDALGYAMRGGKIYVRGDSGYRTGIHMKQYKEKCPIIIVGGKVGSFLGEYLAGGLIIVLGLDSDGTFPAGNFTGTGMHGGEIFVRCHDEPSHLPEQVSVCRADETDHARITPLLEDYANTFGLSLTEILSVPFFRLSPNAKNPYTQLYTENYSGS
jgi:glutamate synthase domain-containing protein 3